MARALNATADEVRLMLANETGQLWRPMKPPLKVWELKGGALFYSFHGCHRNIRCSSVGPFDNETQAWGVFNQRHSPYQPGDTLWVREVWDFDWQTECVIYKVDGGGSYSSWRSPVTMCRGGSRIDIEIVAVAAKQVDGVWQWVFDWRRIKP